MFNRNPRTFGEAPAGDALLGLFLGECELPEPITVEDRTSPVPCPGCGEPMKKTSWPVGPPPDPIPGEQPTRQWIGYAHCAIPGCDAGSVEWVVKS